MERSLRANSLRKMITDLKTRFWISLILTIPILLLSPMVQELVSPFFSLAMFQFEHSDYPLLVFSSLIFFYGGWPFLYGMYQESLKGKPGMMTLIGLAITTAYVYSASVVLGLPGNLFFWELATLIDIMLLGHWIEMKSVIKASSSLEKLVELLPLQAHKEASDGSTTDINLKDIALNDRLLVKPGEKIPADGKVIKGETTINESMLTGESKPINKTIGDTVIGGSINNEGAITIQVKKIGENSFLSQIITMVKQAQDSKSKTQELANRAASWLTFIALGAAFITLIVWTQFTDYGLAFALERVVTVMVISCPHALGLAIPLVIAVSTTIGAKQGLLIRNRAAFETARKINTMIFDKTGTLTEGNFGVTDILIFTNVRYTEAELLNYAVAIEEKSEHFIAKGISKGSAKENIYSATEHWPVEKFRTMPGKGAEGIVNGKNVKVVSPGYLKEVELSQVKNAMENSKIATMQHQGKTVIFVIIDNQLCGAIALADIIRPESKLAIQELKKMGIRSLMLTGDNKQVSQWVDNNIELDSYFAEVLPQNKVDKIKEVQEKEFIVGMVGDGINDAPALAQADVGIAIGAGTDIALEAADIILVRSNPLDVVALVKLSRITTKKMMQNLVWATGYNAIAIPIAAGALFSYGILLSPAVGAALMSISTIIVAINAATLKLPGNMNKLRTKMPK